MNRKSSQSKGRTPPSSQKSGSRGTRKTQSQGAEDAGKKKNAPRGSSQKQRSMTQFLDGGEQSQSTSKVPQMSEEQVLEMAQSVVYFLITCGKDGNAVNRTDIQKTVLKNFPAKHYPVVMSKVAEILKDVFAMEMKNLDGDDEKFDKLILIDTHSIPNIVEDEDEKATQTLLLLILNCVQIAGEKIKEEQLLNFLSELNISYSKHDENFGDVEGKVNSFKNQSYLKFDVDKSTIPPTKLILLGPRAKAEINNLEMMSFSKKLYPDLAFLSEAAATNEGSDEESSEEESD